MGELKVLDMSGDTKHIWDSEKDDEVEAMETLFEELTEKGYKAFKVDKDGDKGKKMKKFDPSAEKMIMVPPLQGG